MRKIFTLSIIAILACTWVTAQNVRYIDEVFSNVTTVTNQIYSVNITVVTGAPAPDTLLVDFYLPAGDSCTARPLAVVLPTGTFLPRGFIAPTGDKDDYANIQIATRLSKQGYVAASIQYRAGWNPLGDDVTRRSTIINAAYRGIQDLYAFLRYMNKTVDDLGNPYRIDPNRVALFGIGTGAFVAFNAAVLQQDEIFIDKFRNPVTGTPYINTALVGDLHGVDQGAINIPNHVGYKDDFHFVFGLDGAIGDSTWIEDGNSVPLVAGGNVNHPTTPYGIDDLGLINCDLPVFAAGQFVVNVGGSACIAEEANSLGINNPLNKVVYNDPVSEQLRKEENGFNLEHLWPINQPGEQTGPWEYWDSVFWKMVPHPFGGTIHSNAILTNPDMGFEKANRYIDTALWFFSPRAFTALRLNELVCNCENVAAPDPSSLLVNDFECHRNYAFGAGNDRLMIMDNPDIESGNKTLKVGAYSDPINDPWAALCVDFGGNIDLSTYNVFKIDVNSPAAGVPFLFKLEGGSSPAVEVWVTTTSAGTWETLTVDFSSQASANHTRLCIFPNAGVESPTAAIYLLDNLRFEDKVRYIDEVFTDIVKISDQVYSINVTVVTGAPTLDTLLFDIYLPAGDTCTSRPLAVVLHTGTFLPRGFIAPTGDKDDYANVQIATRLAKRGYVATSIQYRKGWNPLGDDITRRSTIINAAYRGIQDLHAFLRYMNMTVDDHGNPYKIDTDRVSLFGIGTGAFVAFNAAVLQQEEIYIDKFRNPVTGVPYIDTFLVGNLTGEREGLINLPNHVGYKDDFHFVFGLDGAVGDSSWMEDGTSVPLVAGGNVNHPTTPYGIDEFGEIHCDLPVFAAGQFVVNVGGSVCVIEEANSLGINNPLNKNEYDDPVSEALRRAENGFNLEHLWPINQPGEQTGPWEWWDCDFWSMVPHPFGGDICSNAKLTNPDMSIEKANRYIDTALWFFSPRSFTALKLNEVVCSCEGVTPQDSFIIINDFECHKNYSFGAGNDRLMIMDNPYRNQENGSEKIGAYADPANDPWAALCVIMPEGIPITLADTFMVDVFSPAVGIPFLIKLEGGGTAFEVWVMTTTAGEWETFKIDISSQILENHTRICIFPNAGVETSAETVYIFDNFRIKDGISGLFNPKVETLNIYPNPVEHSLFIRNPGSAVSFVLYNVMGQQVLVHKSSGDDFQEIFVNHLNSGIYMMGAYDGSGKLIGNARIMKN